VNREACGGHRHPSVNTRVPLPLALLAPVKHGPGAHRLPGTDVWLGHGVTLRTLTARLERKGSASAGSNVISEPRREAELIEVTARQSEGGGHNFFLGGINAKPVQPEE